MSEIEEKEPLCNCDICGKDLYDGDIGYGTTTGRVTIDFEGFGADTDEPWLTVACHECGELIGDAIATLEVHYEPPFAATPEKMIEALREAYRWIGEAMIDFGLEDDGTHEMIGKMLGIQDKAVQDETT